MAPTPRVRSPLAWALVVLGAVLLVVAYALPTVTYERLGSPQETYSIYGGIEVLWEDGNWFLATIVFFFSIIFPVAKLVALMALLTGRVGGRARAWLLEWIGPLGKWSMLDVFVIAIFVCAIQLQVATATSRPGIHVFTAAIVASMVATSVVLRAERSGALREVRVGELPRSALRSILALAGLASIALVLALPLFAVRKAVKLPFAKEVAFSAEFALPRSAWEILELSEQGLALALLVWVVALPVLRALLSLRLRLLPGGHARTRRIALALDEWAMLDVFALGLAVGYVKLDELTELTLDMAFWGVFAAALLGTFDAFLLRRDLHPMEPG